MKTLGPFAAMIVILAPLAAFAHGGGKHIMGTVKAVGDKALTVETKDKKEVRVSVDQETKFEKAGSPATIKDLAVGERVVVHTAKSTKPDDLKAVEVKFGAPAAGASTHEGHEHHGEEAPAKK